MTHATADFDHNRARRPHRTSAWRFTLLLVGLTLALHAALLPRFASAVVSDLGDPLLNVWILWWNAFHVPLTESYWNAPAFAPAPNALALSETLLGLTWMTSPLQWLGASPVVAYNAAYVALPVLNGLSAYWLCYTLTRRSDAAAIGGLAFAFAPYHASQLSHLQTQAMFWMPLTLVGLHRFWDTDDRRWLACFALGVALNGLTCGYFLLYFGVFLALAVAWLAISRWNRTRLTSTFVALALAGVAILPVALKYRDVQETWGLGRPVYEIESFGADLLAITIGSDRLLLWPVHAPQSLTTAVLYPLYPGLIISLLLASAALVAYRARRPLPSAARWRSVAAWTLAAGALLAFAAALAAWVGGPWALGTGAIRISVTETYKPIGVALYLAALAAVVSPRFRGLLQSGSMPGLYATGALVSFAMALGPVPRALGTRFWYRAPYQWLMSLPGFNAARVPALFLTVAVLCLSVLAAYAIARLWPQASRAASLATALIAAAIVLDGWVVVPVAELPKPMPPTAADLVIELPRYGPFEDARAMYHGMSHGRPVINGYSGYEPPHYRYLVDDLRAGCLDSLDDVRGGHSLDIVVWPDDRDASMLDDALRARWGDTRVEQMGAIVYHLPRSTASGTSEYLWLSSRLATLAGTQGCRPLP